MVINLCLLALVPAVLCFALFVKVVRIQTRAHDSGPWHFLALLLRVKAARTAEKRDDEEASSLAVGDLGGRRYEDWSQPQ